MTYEPMSASEASPYHPYSLQNQIARSTFNHDQSALLLAALEEKSLLLIERALEYNADPNTKNSIGRPLLIVALYTQIEAAIPLLEYGADALSTDLDGECILSLALRYYVHLQVNIARFPDFNLLRAQQSCIQVLKILLQKGANPNIIIGAEQIPALIYVFYHNIPIFSECLRAHANPNVFYEALNQTTQTQEIHTPLHVVLQTGQLTNAKLLLRAGARILDDTAEKLLNAIQQRNVERQSGAEMLILLISLGANPPKLCDHSTGTRLTHLLGRPNIRARINKKRNIRYELFRAIAEHNNPKARSLILLITTYILDQEGDNLLFCAIKANNEYMANLIFSIAPILLITQNYQGQTPLDYLYTFNNPLFRALLLRSQTHVQNATHSPRRRRFH